MKEDRTSKDLAAILREAGVRLLALGSKEVTLTEVVAIGRAADLLERLPVEPNAPASKSLLIECAESLEENCAHEGRLSSFVDLARRCREAADEPSATLPPKLDTTMPSVWHFLLVAAHEVVEAVDFNHAHKDSPLKWTVPWAKVTALRAAVLRAKELNGAGLPEPPVEGLRRAKQIIEGQDTFTEPGGTGAGLLSAEVTTDYVNAYRDQILDLIDDEIEKRSETKSVQCSGYVAPRLSLQDLPCIHCGKLQAEHTAHETSLCFEREPRYVCTRNGVEKISDETSGDQS